ncbi:hypothetical protein GCM10009772_19340 [Pseudonocardia alni subsp. carboxydivorans]|uniref:Universal stress protein family protein n=1 Tax=Pseudonocardia alni subsp. carboxydivorans TaxID=415010 RepID=A0ABU9AKU1_PSEA5
MRGREDATAAAGPRRGPVVVVGRDELDPDDVRWAAGVARRSGRDLRLVVVVPPPRRTVGGPPTGAARTEMARRLLDAVTDEVAVETGEVDLEAELRRDGWDRVLRDEARTAGLVVLARYAAWPAHPPAGCPVVRAGRASRRRDPAPEPATFHRLTAGDAAPGPLPQA